MIEKQTTKRSINTLRGVSSDTDNTATNDRIRSESNEESKYVTGLKKPTKRMKKKRQKGRNDGTEREREREREIV